MAERIEVIIDGQAYGLVRAAGQSRAAVRTLGREVQVQTRTAGAYNAVIAQQQRNLAGLARAARMTGAVMTGALALGMAHAIRTGADFEAQMSRVQAVANASGEEMERLRRIAIRLGAETKFSASEAAAAMYELSSAGFSVAEMANSIEGVLALAAASNIELADAAEISSNALRGFGLDASQAQRVADVLAQVVNASSVEMRDLQLTMKYIAPIAKATGQSFESMTAAVGLMGDAGIKGEQAGTTLRAGLIRLVNPTKMVTDGLKQLGLSTDDLVVQEGRLAGQMLPLPQLIGKLADATEGLSAAERNQALSRIFGNEALSGMLTLIDAGGPKLRKLEVELDRSAGAADKAAKTMQRNVAGAWEEFGGSIETVEIKLFEHFRKPLRDALVEATKLVNREGRHLDEFFENLLADPAFRHANIVEKVEIAIRELRRSNVGSELEKVFADVDFSELFADAISAAIPAAAEAAFDGGMEVLGAFLRGFTQANVAGKLVLGYLLIRRLGLTDTIFRRQGEVAGTAFAQGLSTSQTANQIAAAAVPTTSAFRRSAMDWERRASGLIVPAGVQVGTKAGQAAGESMTEGMSGRLSGLANRLRGIGRGILGVNLALGIGAGIASQAPTIEGKLQDAFSSMTLGLVPSWQQEADEAVAAWQRGLRRGFDRSLLADALGLTEETVGDLERFGILSGQRLQRGLMQVLSDYTVRTRRAERITDDWRAALQRARDEGTITDQTFAEFSDTIDSLQGAFDRGKRRVNSLRDDIHRLRVGFHGDLSSIQADTEKNMEAIERSFGRHSKIGKDLLASNYKAAERAIRRAMEQGEIDTEEGLEAIEDLIRKRLRLLGFKGANAEKIIKLKKEGRGDGVGGYSGAARGGEIKRVPGQGLADTVPLAINGAMSAVVAPGEDVAVINRHQRPLLDAAVATVYGVGGLGDFFRAFDRPHYMARGGFPMVTGDTDFSPQLGAALSRMARATGRAIFVQSGGRTLAEQAALYQRYLSGSGNLAAPPNPNAPHVRGIAADITPGQEVFGSVAGRFGLAFPVAGEPWHIELRGGGGGGAALVGPGGIRINLPRFAATAPAFVPGAVELNRTAATLEEEIARRIAAAMPEGTGAAIPNMQGPWRKVLERIAAERGWSVADWLWIIGKESGGNPNAKNPSSTAFGLGQLLDTTYRRYGGGPGSSAAEQIVAMAAYIADRYGDPTAARAFWEAHGWYAQGGIAGPARGGAGTGRIPDTRRARIRYLGQTIRRLQGTEPLPGARRRIEDISERLQRTRDRRRDLRDELRELQRELPELRGRERREALGRIDRIGEILASGRFSDARVERLREERSELRQRLRRAQRRRERRVNLLDARREGLRGVLDELRELRAERRRAHFVAGALNTQLGSLFGELPELPYLGAFAAGTGGRRIGRTGIALVHRDEQIVPDRQGPFGNQLTAKPIGRDTPIDVRLTVAVDGERLVRVIDARIDGRKADIARTTDRQLGRRQRRLSFAPGG